MDVAGQTLSDEEVVEFLTLVKAVLESAETEENQGSRDRMPPGLMRRWPFVQEWQVVMNAGRTLFGMGTQESGSQS